jgi:phage-related protein
LSRDAGYQFYRVQGGHDADGEYRVLYLATRPEAVYVLHAFGKKRQGTPTLAVDLAQARLKELLRLRRRD